MPFTLKFLLAATLVFAGAGTLRAQQPAPAAPALVIHLEQLVNNDPIPMHADHVFKDGDVVRFRLSSQRNGYLYVIDRGSSGQYTVLFPAADSRNGNRIVDNTDYFVPATGEGWFQVSGPAGFDTLYFLLSLAPLNVSAAPQRPAATPALPPSLLPRCNDEVFRARGECVDPSAGPAVLPRGAVLPPQIQTAAPGASRDITLVHEDDDAVGISVPADAPAVYTFRLAHH